MNDTFRKSLITVLRDQLHQKRTVELEGLGTFKSIHIKQYQKPEPDGRIVLMPPIDYILFTPEKKEE
jgi:nucleoid DNA-binding protein